MPLDYNLGNYGIPEPRDVNLSVPQYMPQEAPYQMGIDFSGQEQGMLGDIGAQDLMQGGMGMAMGGGLAAILPYAFNLMMNLYGSHLVAKAKKKATNQYLGGMTAPPTYQTGR